jgi:hypothetical protein
MGPDFSSPLKFVVQAHNSRALRKQFCGAHCPAMHLLASQCLHRCHHHVAAAASTTSTFMEHWKTELPRHGIGTHFPSSLSSPPGYSLPGPRYPPLPPSRLPSTQPVLLPAGSMLTLRSSRRRSLPRFASSRSRVRQAAVEPGPDPGLRHRRPPVGAIPGYDAFGVGHVVGRRWLGILANELLPSSRVARDTPLALLLRRHPRGHWPRPHHQHHLPRWHRHPVVAAAVAVVMLGTAPVRGSAAWRHWPVELDDADCHCTLWADEQRQEQHQECPPEAPDVLCSSGVVAIISSRKPGSRSGVDWWKWNRQPRPTCRASSTAH